MLSSDGEEPAGPAVSLDRRTFLRAAGTSAVAVGALGTSALPAQAASLGVNPFTLGVASGDAWQRAVVLWTRLAPQPLRPDRNFGMGGRTRMKVLWRIATSSSGLNSRSTSLQAGEVTASKGNGFAVHIDVRGLQPGRHYWYRFYVARDGGGWWRSPVGRTRTANAGSDDRAVKFAVVNCQNIARPGGGEYFFNGLRHLKDRNDIDFVVFLGDYIYEFGRPAHEPARTVSSVADYRTRHGQYKLRASLKEVHRRFPVYVMPDDHEFWNDYKGGDLGAAGARRFNRAMHVFWEHMPIRNSRPGAVSNTTPNHVRLFRRISWGSELQMFLADTRQYRGSSLLGGNQTDQLLTWLRNTTATWTTIATPTPLWQGAGSGWSAYTSVRNDVTRILANRKANTPRRFNPVVLSGDIHCGTVAHVRRYRNSTSRFVATEFINAPMTSRGDSTHGRDAVKHAYGDGNGRNLTGYMVCTVRPDRWVTRYIVGNNTTDPGGNVSGRRAWELNRGARVGSVHLL